MNKDNTIAVPIMFVHAVAASELARDTIIHYKGEYQLLESVSQSVP